MLTALAPQPHPTLDDDALYALVDRVTSIVLIDFLAPHASQLGLRGQGAHGSSRAALLGHRLGTGGLGFGNQALNSYLLVRGCCGSCLLMNDKLLFLQFSYSCSDGFISRGLSPGRSSVMPDPELSRRIVTTSLKPRT